MTEPEPSPKRPTGRRGGDSGTRDAILDAARDLFAARGYDGASVRAIAAAASVDPALIRHFFDDKQSLFAATVASRTAIPQRLGGLLSGDPATLGVRVTDTYLRLWEETETRPVLMALVRSAITSERAADMLIELMGTRVRTQAGDETRARRVTLAASHLLGTAIARYIVKVPAIAALDHDTLVAEIAPTIQRYLTAGGTRS